jgi:hypothetical protein
MYWSYMQGIPTTGTGTLVKQSGETLPAEVERSDWICTTELARTCMQAYQDTCDEHGETVMPLACYDASLYGAENNLMECVYRAGCPGYHTSQSWSNETVGLDPFGDLNNPLVFPGGTIGQGEATVVMPRPPFPYGFYDLWDYGDTYQIEFESRWRQGCGGSSFYRDQACGTSTYSSTNGDVQLNSGFKLVFNLNCYEQIRGPNPTGRCMYADQFLTGRNATLPSDPPPMGRPGELADFSVWNYINFSEQLDGSFYWTLSFGNLVMSEGALSFQPPSNSA